MSENTGIEWTDATWNPVRGCTKISPGCKHCYAEVFAERWRGVPGHAYEQGFDLRLVPEKLSEPLRWRKSRRVFVNSMSDLFNPDVPFEYVDEVFAAMVVGGHHTYQVLTKRAEFMRWYMNRAGFVEGRAKRLMRERGINVPQGKTLQWPPPHVWLGVSVEDKEYGLPRIDELRATPAAVRFLSIEPLLEDLGAIDLTGIDWVIVGGESGRGARRMEVGWVRSIRDQCIAARVSFFFKQWGEWCRPDQLPGCNSALPNAADIEFDLMRVGKAAAGRELDGRTWDEMPEVRR
jgi:protein gp37